MVQSLNTCSIFVGGSLDRNSATVRERSIDDVGNGQISGPMSLDSMTDILALKMEVSINDRVKRMEQMFAAALEAHISPYHQQMQFLMENAVSESLKTTTVSLSPATNRQISETQKVVNRLDHRLKIVEAQVALALGIEASTPGR
jgi:hypothetical protein